MSEWWEAIKQYKQKTMSFAEDMGHDMPDEEAQFGTQRQSDWNINTEITKNLTKMKGTVKSVLGAGTFKDLYKFDVEIKHEDGSSDVYTKYSKKDNAWVSANDVITFETNDNKKLMNVEKAGSQGDSNPTLPDTNTTDKPYVPAINPEKQLSIIRQSSLKVAIDYMIQYYPDKKIQPEEVCKVADYFVYYVETGNIPEKPKLSEGHPRETIEEPPF